MNREDFDNLNKDDLVDVILNHYNTLKRVATEQKERSVSGGSDLMCSVSRGYYAGCETYANKLHNDIFLIKERVGD